MSVDRAAGRQGNGLTLRLPTALPWRSAISFTLVAIWLTVRKAVRLAENRLSCRGNQSWQSGWAVLRLVPLLTARLCDTC